MNIAIKIIILFLETNINLKTGETKINDNVFGALVSLAVQSNSGETYLMIKQIYNLIIKD